MTNSTPPPTMEPTLLLRLFQRQVAGQCFAALLAGEQAQKALDAHDLDRFWPNVQNCLTAVANISKAMWGEGGKLDKERAPLRQSLGVEPTSPLKDTRMRNNFEHFDERLDRWWDKSPQHLFVDRNIGPDNMFGGIDISSIFRHYNHQTGELIFWGTRYPLKDIIAEVERLLPVATQEASKPHGTTPSTSGGGH